MILFVLIHIDHFIIAVFAEFASYFFMSMGLSIRDPAAVRRRGDALCFSVLKLRPALLCQDVGAVVLQRAVMGFVSAQGVGNEAAFLLHPGGPFVAKKMGAEYDIQPDVFKQVTAGFLYSFGHQTLPPAVLCQHEAQFAAALIGQFGKAVLGVLFYPQRTDRAAVILQREGLFVLYKTAQYLQ
jgi:hypothetical protein